MRRLVDGIYISRPFPPSTAAWSGGKLQLISPQYSVLESLLTTTAITHTSDARSGKKWLVTDGVVFYRIALMPVSKSPGVK